MVSSTAGVLVYLLFSVTTMMILTGLNAQTSNNYIYSPYPGPNGLTLYTRTCNPQWSGCYCDVPVCSPACAAGQQVCVAVSGVNKCQCLGSTANGVCQFTQCTHSPYYDCYPGTCSSDGVNCTCPTQWGFSGVNCVNITNTPAITSCSVELLEAPNNAIVNTGYCALTGSSSTVDWTNASTLAALQIIFTATYTQLYALPQGSQISSYISNAPTPIGIANMSYDVTFIEDNKYLSPVTCYSYQGSQISTSQTCNVQQSWKDFDVTPIQNHTFMIKLYAMLGGQKIVVGTQNPINFYGAANIRNVLFRFDIIPPKHCLSSNPPSACPYFPIYLDQDIRTNQIIQPKFYNWTDDGSGIDHFHVEIYNLGAIPGQNVLTNIGQALQGSVQDVDPIQNNYAFTMTNPGIYSIELTVFDKAGNIAKARKLFIYNTNSGLETVSSQPIYLDQADPSINYTWLNNYNYPMNGGYIPLTVTWAGHFMSSATFNQNWALAAQGWTSTTAGSANFIDDNFGMTYGRRSIAAIVSTPGGIESYAVAFVVDPTGGGRGFSPFNWVFLNATITSYSLPISNVTDGGTIVIWVQCTDVAFNTLTEQLTISVSRTSPLITSATYSLMTGPYKTNTSVSISVVDMAAGISQISYLIVIGGLTQPNWIHTAPQTVPSPPPPSQSATKSKRSLVEPCYSGSQNCYCIPIGTCYPTVQVIEIDNCDIDRFAGQYFQVQYYVTNNANLNSTQQSLDMGFLQANQIECRLTAGLSGGAIAGIVIGVIIGFLLLLLLAFILFLLIRIYFFKKEPPRRFKNFQKTMRDTFSRDVQDENAAYVSSDQARGASSKQTGHGHRRILTLMPLKKQVNVEKGKKMNNDNDDYIYTASDDLRNMSSDLKIPRRNLQMEETISTEGRFAVIKKAYLHDGNERKVVAVKALKSGFSAGDVKLMEEKINFFSDFPRHANIVNFLGTSEDENNGGPFMVLEYCDKPLKDWLKENKKVTSEVLENMLTFTLNIARGVEHLHDNNVVHRRLAVRNVLLTPQFNGLVAKLIGFGPTREDEDKTKKVAVPVKWLAPETLSTINDIDPTYTNATDAWSYGITACEIYANGETPFPNKNSNEAKKLIIKGLKPERPNECPPELFESAIAPCFETNPNGRPDFHKICNTIETFRHGSQGDNGGGGYYTTEDEEYAANEVRNRGRAVELYDDAK